MKVIEAHSGLLTNFEVFDLLRSRGAEQGFGAINSVAPSELKVFNYLTQTPAATQSRDAMTNFLRQPLAGRLMKPERLQVANLRPTSLVEVHLAVEEIQKRFTEEEVEKLITVVAESLPEPPVKPEAAAADADAEATAVEEDPMEED